MTIKNEQYWIEYFSKQKAAQKKWREKNADKVASYQENWRLKNPEKVKSYRTAYNKRRWQLIKQIKQQLKQQELDR